jgi:hypothetical protein
VYGYEQNGKANWTDDTFMFRSVNGTWFIPTSHDADAWYYPGKGDAVRIPPISIGPSDNSMQGSANQVNIQQGSTYSGGSSGTGCGCK